MQDLWLLKMSTAIPRKMLCLAAHSPAWHSLDGEVTYVYSPDRVDPSTNAVDQEEFWRRLSCLQVLDGASVGKVAAYHYVVETDVLPEVEEELNAWYSQEHLPGLASVAGTVSARRYIDREGSPRYYACYDLESPDALASAAWLAVRGTSWSARVRPAFRNTRRTMFRRA